MLEKCPSCKAEILLPTLGDLSPTVTCAHCNTTTSIADFSIHTGVRTDLVLPPPPATIAPTQPPVPAPPRIVKPPVRREAAPAPQQYQAPPPQQYQAPPAPAQQPSVPYEGALELHTSVPPTAAAPSTRSWTGEVRPDVATTDPTALASLTVDHTARTAFELETVGAQGYDDRMIVPSRGIDFGTIVRSLVGVGWGLVTLQAIAWWGFHADPAGLAQYVPPEVAVILPSDLRPPEVIKPKRPTRKERLAANLEDDLTVDSPAVATNEPVDSAPPVNDDVAESKPKDTLTFGPPVRTASYQQLKTESPDVDLISTPSAEEGAAGGAPVPDYVNTNAAPPRLNPESIFVGHGPRWTDETTAEDVTAAAGAMRRASQTFDEAQLLSSDNEARRRAAKLCYAVACSLAERATMVGKENAAQCTSNSRDAIREIAGHPTKVNMFSNAARNWVSRRLGKGVATGARVSAIRQVGDLFEITMQLLDSKSTLVTVVTRSNPADNPWCIFGVGEKIFFLGVVVDDPEVRLPGYLGNEQWVIYMTNQAVRIP